MVKRIYLDIIPTESHRSDETRDAALSALSEVDLIEQAEGKVGIFGKAHKRDYKAEKVFRKGREWQE